MQIDISQVKKLKDLTGVGLSEAKAALNEANGDFDAALKAMRIKGLTKAEKRSEREAREGLVGTYSHDGKIGVLVEVNCETDFVAKNDIFKDLVKDLCLQVAASDPKYVDYSEVSKEEIDRVKQELTEKSKKDGKPEAMISKIVDGQLKKHFADQCLLDQPFIKNPDLTVGELVKEHNAKLGENIIVRRFSRIAIGQ